MKSVDEEFIAELPPEGSNLNGVQKGRLNKKNLLAYLKLKEKHEEPFAVNQNGEVNTSLVSRICNFERQVFNDKSKTKSKLRAELDRVVALVGTVVVKAKKSSNRDDDVKSLTKQLNDEKRDNGLAAEKISGLTKQIFELKQEVRRLNKKSSEDHESLESMIETGRRFSL
jgi:hypothetical protein